ncbi:MAG: rod shape-determining protein MreD [Holosporaceae bacterium]
MSILLSEPSHTSSLRRALVFTAAILNEALPFLTFVLALWAHDCLAFSLTSFPALCHGVLFYWVLRRPDAFSIVTLFVVGLVCDILWGRFVGVTFIETSLLLFMMRSYAVLLRHRPFWMQWLFFTFITTGLALCFSFLALCLGESVAFLTVVASCLWAAVTYPLLFATLSSLGSEESFQLR